MPTMPAAAPATYRNLQNWHEPPATADAKFPLEQPDLSCRDTARNPPTRILRIPLSAIICRCARSNPGAALPQAHAYSGAASASEGAQATRVVSPVPVGLLTFAERPFRPRRFGPGVPGNRTRPT